MATVCVRTFLSCQCCWRTGQRRGRRTHVALLDAVALENVGRLAHLLEELLVRELDVLAGLVRLPDDGGLQARLRASVSSSEARDLCGGERTLFGCLYAQRSTQLYATLRPPSGNHWTSPAVKEPAWTVEYGRCLRGGRWGSQKVSGRSVARRYFAEREKRTSRGAPWPSAERHRKTRGWRCEVSALCSEPAARVPAMGRLRPWRHRGRMPPVQIVRVILKRPGALPHKLAEAAARGGELDADPAQHGGSPSTRSAARPTPPFSAVLCSPGPVQQCVPPRMRPVRPREVRRAGQHLPAARLCLEAQPRGETRGKCDARGPRTCPGS